MSNHGAWVCGPITYIPQAYMEPKGLASFRLRTVFYQGLLQLHRFHVFLGAYLGHVPASYTSQVLPLGVLEHG